MPTLSPSISVANEASRPSSLAPFSPDSSQSSEEVSPAWAWLLGRDPKMRRYIARSLISCLPYVIGTCIAAYCASVGIMSVALALMLVGSRALTLLGLYLAMRSGWTRRFKDPSIALVQIAISLLWIGTMYSLTGPMHAAMLPLLVLSLASATLNLDVRSARHSTWFAVLVMTAVMALMSCLHSEVYVPKVQFCLWVIMASTLPTVLLTSIQLKRLKHRLKTEREELRLALTHLHDLATHDELTGLHNRAHMGEMLEQYLQRYRDGGEVFSIALLDLDLFKRINDNHGHGAGDEVLKSFAAAMQHTLRESDLTARWGGEEFLVLLPQSSAENARAVLERLRVHFAEQVVSPSVPLLRASFSAGVASPAPGETLSMVLERVDQALYAAKSAGRNRCFLG